MLGSHGVDTSTIDFVLVYFTGYTREEVVAMRERIGEIPTDEWAETLTGDELAFARRTSYFWIDGTEPPFLVLHGELDRTIPHEESVRFAEALEAAGSQVELLVIPNYFHSNQIGVTRRAKAVELTETVDVFLAEAFAEDE